METEFYITRYEPGFAGYDIDEVNLLNDIPEEAKDALNDPALKHSVEEMPGSERFKAMVLGLSAFSALRADYEPPEHGQVNPMLPHGEPWE